MGVVDKDTLEEVEKRVKLIPNRYDGTRDCAAGAGFHFAIQDVIKLIEEMKDEL